MNTTFKHKKWLALAMALTMPTTIGVVAMQPVQATLEETAEDPLFIQSKNKITAELEAAGVISKQNAEIIKNAPIKASQNDRIDVYYKDGKLSFQSASSMMERLQKNYPNNRARVAEEYLLEVAEAVGEADMWLRRQGNKNITSSVFTDWCSCVEVSVKNLLLKKNISEEEATASLMASGRLATLMNYVQWNQEKNVFTLNEGLFAQDFGLSTDAGGENGGNHVAAKDKDDSYGSISEEMRTFWQNLKPLEDKQDLDGLKKITSEMCKKTYLFPEITDVVQGTAIQFENLSAQQAQLVNEGNVCYSSTTATVQISPEYVRFFNDVIVPKMCEFFTPLATDISRKKIQVTVCRSEYKNWDQTHGNAVLNASEATYFVFPNNMHLNKEGFYNVYFAKFKDINAVYSAQHNTKVEAELIVFHLPETYSRFCNKFGNLTWDVHHHYQDVNDKWIFSGRHVRVDFSYVWYNDKFSYRGIKLGEFYVSKDSNFKNCVVTFNDKNEQYPYLEEEKAAKEKEKQAELTKEWTQGRLLHIFILLSLFGGICGYAAYILRREYKRRWKELALPEGTTVHLVDEDQLRPEFSAFYEWKDMLLWKSESDNEEESMPYITTKKTLDKGYEVLYNLAALPDLNEHEITTLNLMGGDLNNAQKRYLGSSKWLLAGFSLCFLFFAYFTFPNGKIGEIEFWLDIFNTIAYLTAIAAIFIADLMPSYKFGNEEPILIRGARRVLSAIGAGTWAIAVFMATHRNDTLYKDSSGNVYVEKDDGAVGCGMALAVLSLFIVLLPLIAFGNTVASFYRNYFSNK